MKKIKEIRQERKDKTFIKQVQSFIPIEKIDYITFENNLKVYYYVSTSKTKYLIVRLIKSNLDQLKDYDLEENITQLSKLDIDIEYSLLYLNSSSDLTINKKYLETRKRMIKNTKLLELIDLEIKDLEEDEKNEYSNEVYLIASCNEENTIENIVSILNQRFKIQLITLSKLTEIMQLLTLKKTQKGVYND